ncbi:hypothetical protein [Psychrilyobacter atlanticus]|uniref:hypothetical protein n=1 Tax=Psychrilyobacter atlanticus TaxID=271091 RepID=UPI00040CA16A|nr:hypothetical protein [Psychrilyobacter atlanticus]
MKKKGSALILSILMLSFFMTITLTMYYIARNRNKRSIYKIKGMRISSGLDSGSAIAHYELYLADEYVSKGHPYGIVTTTSYGAYKVDNYTGLPSGTKQYTQEVTSGSEIIVIPITGEHYTGVVLNNYNEYFGARWDVSTGSAMEVTSGATITPEQSVQPWIAEDKISVSPAGILLSRAWLNNTGEKIVRLWTETTGSAISVGGYRLIDISGTDKDGSSVVAPLESSTLDSTTSTSIDLTYEKIVAVSVSGIGEENYRITYIEGVEVTPSGSSIIIDKDELKNMTVEKLK